MSSYKSFGIAISNPYRQGEIKYSSPLQDEEWPPLNLETIEDGLKQTQLFYQDRLPISRLEELIREKQAEHDKMNISAPKELSTELATITYDKDGNAEITIEI